MSISPLSCPQKFGESEFTLPHTRRKDEQRNKLHSYHRQQNKILISGRRYFTCKSCPYLQCFLPARATTAIHQLTKPRRYLPGAESQNVFKSS